MRQPLKRLLLLATALVAMTACGKTSSITTKGRTIVQKPVPQGPFYPTDIEHAVAELITALGPVDAARVPMAVMLKASSTATYWQIVYAGAARAATEIGAPSNLQTVTKEQVLTSIAALGTKYKSFVFSPYDGGDPNLLLALKGTGAHTVLVDSDTTNGVGRDYFFGSDDYPAGQAGGAQLLAALHAQGKTSGQVLVFGANSWPQGQQRTQGILDSLNAAGFTCVQVNANFDTTDGPALQAAINQTSNLVGMLGAFANGYLMVDTLRSVRGSAYTPLPTVVFDSEAQTLSYVQSGDIVATMLQRPFFMGYLSYYVAFAENFLPASVIQSILAEHLTGSFYDTGVDALTQAENGELVSFFTALGVSLQ